MADERPTTHQRPSSGPGGPRKKRPFQRRKVCRFCAEKNLTIDYKEPRTLTEAIKRARNLALLPVASNHALP